MDVRNFQVLLLNTDMAADMTEYQKIINIMEQTLPLDGSTYKVNSIQLVLNKNLRSMFEGEIAILDKRKNKLPFLPTWHQEEDHVLRGQIMSRLQGIQKNHEPQPAVPVLPLWHGCTASVALEICETGLADLQTTDDGFFGRGLYLTNSWEYATRVYSKADLTIILCWTVLGSVYPVVSRDMAKLRGQPHYLNYDSHYVPVKHLSGSSYIPCNAIEEAVYDEFVVFHRAQVLPCCIVTLGRI